MENKIDPVRFDKLYLIRQIINRLYQAEVTTASGLHEFVIVNDSDKTIDLKELDGVDLPRFSSNTSPDVKIGERYISERVISMWDCDDYKDYITYIDRAGIRLVIEVGERLGEKFSRVIKLKKDLSNLLKEDK